MSTALRSAQCSLTRPTPISSSFLTTTNRMERRQHCSTGRLQITRRPRPGNLLVTSAVKESVKSDLPDGQPKGKSKWRHYETIVCLSPLLSTEQRDHELAKLESFLLKEDAQNVEVVVKGLHKLAYPIQKYPIGDPVQERLFDADLLKALMHCLHLLQRELLQKPWSIVYLIQKSVLKSSFSDGGPLSNKKHHITTH